MKKNEARMTLSPATAAVFNGFYYLPHGTMHLPYVYTTSSAVDAYGDSSNNDSPVYRI